MKKLFLPLAALALTGLTGCDADIDSVQPSRQVVASTTVSSLPRLDRYIQQAFAKKYNVDIAYRYDDKVTDRRYLLAPVKEEKALEYLNLIDYMFFQVYEASTPEGYLQTHTIKYLNLFGSSGYAIDRRMAGAAPQGMIWIYNINELNTQYTGTVRSDYISVLSTSRLTRSTKSEPTHLSSTSSPLWSIRSRMPSATGGVRGRMRAMRASSVTMPAPMLTKTSPNSSPTTSSTATASGQTVSRVPKARTAPTPSTPVARSSRRRWRS